MCPERRHQEALSDPFPSRKLAISLPFSSVPLSTVFRRGAPGPPSSGSFRQDDGRRDCCRKGERGRQMLQTASRDDDEAIRSLSSFWLEQAPQESEVRQLNGETAQ